MIQFGTCGCIITHEIPNLNSMSCSVDAIYMIKSGSDADDRDVGSGGWVQVGSAWSIDQSAATASACNRNCGIDNHGRSL